MSPELEREFQKQKSLEKWLYGHLHECEFNAPDERARICIACYELTTEHHSAIVRLFEAGFYGSMFALLRVQIESLIRGQYLYFVAPNKAWDLFKADDKKFTGIRAMLSSLKEAGHDVEHAEIGLNYFHSFTHTGYAQIRRRIKAEKIIGSVNYEESTLIKALNFSGTIAILAMTNLLDFAKDSVLVQQTDLMLE